MADGTSFNIDGVDELKAKLEGISYDARRKGGRYALRKAAQVVRDKAKINALLIDDPETGRAIASNIAERWGNKFFKATGNMKFRIGVLGGKIKNAEKGNPDSGVGGETPHAMLVELGTEHSAAQPYLRSAVEQSANQAVIVFIREYNKAIDRAIRRAAKNGGTA